MFGVEINFKDGSKDWIDPVSDETIEKDGKLSVSNMTFTYDYCLSKIDKWFKYELCKICLHDLRDSGCGDKCTNNYINF